MKPVMIGDKLRIGFVALKAIKKGEELFFDYGIRGEGILWQNTNALPPQCKMVINIDTHVLTYKMYS